MQKPSSFTGVRKILTVIWPVRRRFIFVTLCALVIPMVACSVPFVGSERPTPTLTLPPDQVLSFFAPIYRVTLNPGDSVPGTQMKYVGHENNVYEVTIDGLTAAKRIGDSLNWQGVIAPGILAKYRLRISPTFISDSILAVGTVEVSVLNPEPEELDNLPQENENEVHFAGIETNLTAPRGSPIPGTTLLYEGVTEQGAYLSGTDRYPYWAQGDSLVWSGRLRGNALIRYSLRLAIIEEERIVLPGTVELRVILNR